ncbi:MAG: nitroreductase family protein [Candidatus Woesearchaeota archaeon]
MNFGKLIKERHSIRDYQDKDVKHDLVCEVLEAAKSAPSSGNVQNWVFIVVRNKDKMLRLSSACLDQDWIAQAPALIVICYDFRNIQSLYPKRAVEFSIQNTATATTQMMLKATELGLGTCWVDISDKNEAANCLKLPPHLVPSHLITLGYQKGAYKKTKRNEIQLVTYFEEFGFTKRETNLSAFPLEKNLDKLKKKLIKKRKK